MQNEIAIKVENLSKLYKLYNSPFDRLKESLNPLRRQYHHDFYAINDVSFDIRKGETVGIIGKNGSGKSTLLKILTGVLTPTAGNVHVNGKVSALLELGAGFNPELTGIENIYFNGMLMGYKREEMDERLDDILAFADIGEFVYQPVKTYSSGMFVRLAFAVTINVEPEILIIDEALAVGDANFVLKCLNKLEQLKNTGATIILVSHDMNSIKANCTTAILLDSGQMVQKGKPGDIVDLYNAILFKLLAGDKMDTINIGKQLSDRFEIMKKHRYGSGDALISKVEIYDSCNIESYTLNTLDSATIIIYANFYAEIDNVIVGISIRNLNGIDVYMTNTDWKNIEIPMVNCGEALEVKFNQIMSLNAGKYALTVAVSKKTSDGVQRLDWIGDHVVFEILSPEKIGGFCNLNSMISVIRNSNYAGNGIANECIIN